MDGPLVSRYLTLSRRSVFTVGDDMMVDVLLLPNIVLTEAQVEPATSQRGTKP